MSIAPLLSAPDVRARLAFGSTGSFNSGIRFFLALDFCDETMDQPAQARWTHEWMIPRANLDQVSRQGRVERFLLQSRVREEQVFENAIDRMLQRSHTHFEEQADGSLVLRKTVE